MITPQDLQTAFFEVANHGPVDEYVTNLRQNLQRKYSTKRHSLLSLFNSTRMQLWVDVGTKNGHRKYTHKITGVVVGFQAHGPNNINPGHAEQLMGVLQEHINTLGNEIFKFTTENWKNPPNFNQALVNYNQWKLEQEVKGLKAASLDF
jgi:hypothetical protein